MSHFFVKYGEKICPTLPPFTNISLKIIYFVAPCVSPWARKGPTGDCLMIVGSCIKYTAAGGESTYSLDAGGGGTKAWVESVRKAQSVWVLRLGVKSVMDADHGSYLLDLKSSDLCLSSIFLMQCNVCECFKASMSPKTAIILCEYHNNYCNLYIRCHGEG